MAVYTPESLEIGVSLRVYGNPNVDYGGVLDDMFGQDSKNLPKSLEKRLRELYILHQKLIVNHLGKNFISDFVKSGNVKLIQHFLHAINNGSEAKMFDNLDEANDIRLRLDHLAKLDKAIASYKIFRRYFNEQVKVFIKTDVEDQFRTALKEWLSSGEVNYDTWLEVKQWHEQGCKLTEFLAKTWKNVSSTDVLIHRVQKLAKNITTDEFLEPSLITKLLDRLLEEPETNTNDNRIVVTGKIVFLTKNWSENIKKLLENGARRIEIYADYCCALCDDLCFPETNLVISTGKFRIWKKTVINLSGKSYDPNPRKAKNATHSEECGKNDGGDGFTGRDGKGVERNEMESLCNFYSSLYFGCWSTFIDYNPAGWERTKYNYNTSLKYVYKKFSDSSGRKLLFSYAGISFNWYTPDEYHLFVWVRGAEGQKGTKGGVNGLGGEGGYRGECLVMNPETGQHFNVNATRAMGENGKNGVVGTSGTSGKRGNDLAIIDSSGGEKLPIGDEQHTLKLDWFNCHGDMRRFFGYKKHCKNKSHPFIKFELDKEPSRTYIENTVTQRQMDQCSKAVAQNEIITDEIMQRSRENFEGESTFVENVSLKLSDEIEEEAEEGTEEECTEQVVVLRQADGATINQYTSESLKKAKIPPTASQIVAAVKKDGRFGSITATAQNLFDLFTVEMDWQSLRSIRFQTLFQKNHFVHAVKENPLSLLLIAINQDSIQNGKSFDEIKQFATTVSARRQLKYLLTEHRETCSNVTDKLTSEVELNCSDSLLIIEDASMKNSFVEGARKGEQFEISDEDMNKIIMNLNADISSFMTSKNELIALWNFLKKIPNDMRNLIEEFRRNDIVWCKGEGEKFMAALSTKIKTEKDDGNDEQSETQSSNVMNSATSASSKIEIPLETRENFKHLIESIKTNLAIIVDSLVLVKDLFKNNDNAAKRYGELPELVKENISTKERVTTKLKGWWNKEEKKQSKILAAFVVKTYFIANEVLPFNRRLYNCNELVRRDNSKLLQAKPFINDADDPKYDSFIEHIKCQSLDVTSNYCDEQMRLHKMSSSALLYLISLHQNVNIIPYKFCGYQRLKQQFSFRPIGKANRTYSLWIDGSQAYHIEIDTEYRKFTTSQRMVIDSCPDFLKKHVSSAAPSHLADFFQSEFQSTVTEWVDGYLATTNYDALLKFLSARFFADGCLLGLFELQFVLSTFTHLHIYFRADLTFLLAALTTVSQRKFVDILLYIRLCYRYEQRLKANILHNIKLIDNSHHKIIFALKFTEYKDSLPVETLYKIILMLQYSSTESDKLQNLTMDMWIDIAEKQTWSEIGSMMKSFGPVGYYIGVLDIRGFKAEQQRVREMLMNVRVIPEKLLGLLVSLICSGEFEDNIEILDDFESRLMKVNNWQDDGISLEKNGEYATLLTDEKQQNRLFEAIGFKHEDFGSCRTINDLRRLVVGKHGDEEKDADVRKKVNNYCDYLQDMADGKKPRTKVCEILAQFDVYLNQLFHMSLRITQKMAVLCAVESDKHVIEQVNTGEGKSFIIAAIAIVRCIRDNTRVDIITSSPVLAERDVQEMRPLFEKFKLTAGHNCSESIDERKRAYTCNIVYGDIQRFQRDYLMQTFYKKTILGNRRRDVVIVDEVDNMLLDNGNNILYLSHNVPCLDILESTLIHILKKIRSPIFSGIKDDIQQMKSRFDTETIADMILEQIFGRFTLEDAKRCIPEGDEEKAKNIHEFLVCRGIVDSKGFLMTSSANQIQNIEAALEKKGFSTLIAKRVIGSLRIVTTRECEIQLPTFLRPFVKLHLHEFIDNCKKAMLMKEEYEYVVDYDRTGAKTHAGLEPAITIIDSNTGADLPTTQWTGGLHQSLQLKHGCRLSPISLKAVFVSNVAYLKGYNVINGLSGTLGSHHESKTLIDMYGAELIRIPTFKPKIFYENSPIITTCSEEWVKSVYDEICDQINVGRSLLVICDSIAQAKTLQDSLIKLYKNDANDTPVKNDCFNNLTMYLRSYEEFTFKKGNELQPNRLIIATNLAGRGTDIKLSDQLQKNGGLHVITFMPRNARIEEQAFGRAARCGQPGSAQIIALLNEKDGVKPSFFQFKMYRDNLEVQRLAELKVFYEYHTEIEECCLEKFREHCDDVLSKVYSSNAGDAKIQRPEEVVYFALLDKWALWLDEKGTDIEQCSKNNNDVERNNQKKAIIQSVEGFLNQHNLDVKHAQSKWLDFPQSLLTIGLYSMCNEDFSNADQLFDKIIDEDLHFAAEAYYYKACMRMPTQAIKETNYTDINLSERFFHFSRTLFQQRLNRCEQESVTVMQFLNEPSNSRMRSSGFEEQHKAISNNLQVIIGNIDWLIGVPCSSDMFANNKISKEMSAQIYSSLELTGVIAPSVFINHKPQKWMLQSIHDIFGITDKETKQSIIDMKTDMLTYYRDPEMALKPDSQKNIFDSVPNSDDNNAFRLAVLTILPNHVNLSNRQSFYVELYESGVIHDVQHVKYVDDNYETEVRIAMEEKQIVPIELPIEGHHILLNNSMRENRSYYSIKDLKALGNSTIQEKMCDEFIGKIDIKRLKHFSYFSEFDGVTAHNLADYFGISIESAMWILRTLEDHDVLEYKMEKRARFTANNDLWKEKVEVFLESIDESKTNPNEKVAKDAKKLKNLTQQIAISLQELRNYKGLQNVSLGLLKYICKLEKDEDVKTLYTELLEEELIEEFLHCIYRLNSRLDVSSLPEAISDSVAFYMSNKLAYSFALERLSIDIDAGNESDQLVHFHSIFLPEFPYKQYFNLLKSTGIVMPPRIITKEYQHIDDDAFEHIDDVKATLREYASKLLDQTSYHLTLVPLEKYVVDQGQSVNAELKFATDRGMKLVVSLADGNTAWSTLTNIIGATVSAVKRVVSVTKSIGSWFYNIGSSIASWIGDNIVDPIADRINKAVSVDRKNLNKNKSGIASVIQYVTNSKAFKVACNCVNATGRAIAKIGVNIGKAAYEVGEMTGLNAGVRKIARVGAVIGNKVQEAAKYVAEKAVELGEGAKKIATEAFNYIAESRVIKWASDAAKNVLNYAKYVYRKMSQFVNAVFESYEYYNQCRVYARKIAAESSNVDEYTILRSYVNARETAAQEESSDDIFEKKLLAHLNYTHDKAFGRLKGEIREFILQEARNYKIPCGVDPNFIKSFVAVCPSALLFNNEIQEKYTIESSKAMIVFAYLMTEFATNDAPFGSMEMPQLESNFSFNRLEGTVRKVVIDFATHSNYANSPTPVANTNIDMFVQDFTKHLCSMAIDSCRSIYVVKPGKNLLSYMMQLRKPGEVPEMAEFDREDVSLKAALALYNSQTLQKKQNNSILKEFVRSLQSVIGHVDVLKVAVKYGYPLPIIALGTLVPALSKITGKSIKIE
ncbi:hypothetical protein WR25_21480, partial [Diploscapter pachys]